MRSKTIIYLFILIVSFGLAFPTLHVQAQGIGSQIEQVLPTEKVGVVGQTISVFGSIDTRNGRFEVFFGTQLVANATAQDNSVSASFTIPQTPAGQYRITLRDVALNNNATSDFTLNTSYSVLANVPPTPQQMQEGNIVSLNVTVTGGLPSAVYLANITVTIPTPLNTNYSQLIALPTTNQQGTATTQISYPDNAFDPSGSNSKYAGIYTAHFNLTQTLASSEFSIGFTELTEYHRGQTVKIRATGYQANDSITVTVRNQESGEILYNVETAPSNDGAVSVDWTVPSSAAIGKYDLNITARSNPKPVPDYQVITIHGYPVIITPLDLSGRAVAQILVEARDTVTNKTYQSASNNQGNATINLETGNHILTAFWNGLQVGETSVNVVGAGAFELQCELTNIKIVVKDRNGLLIPSVSLDISYEYLTTREEQHRTGNFAGETDLSGTYALNSIPPKITYSINASVYGAVFNAGNDTLNELPISPFSEVTILCPPRTLTFKIVDFNRDPMPDARLALIEVNAAIFYSSVTGSDGSAAVETTFGRYRTQVYAGNVLLNETEINAFSNMEVQIQCVLYNLNVNVEVSDYFGQPIGDINVRLVEPDGNVVTEKTQSSGIAIFDRVVGGDLQITAFLGEEDDYYEAKNIRVESPTTVVIQMGRYVSLGGLLMQTSLFITFILIVPVIGLFILLELYQKRRSKPNKTSQTVGKSQAK